MPAFIKHRHALRAKLRLTHEYVRSYSHEFTRFHQTWLGQMQLCNLQTCWAGSGVRMQRTEVQSKLPWCEPQIDLVATKSHTLEYLPTSRQPHFPQIPHCLTSPHHTLLSHHSPCHNTSSPRSTTLSSPSLSHKWETLQNFSQSEAVFMTMYMM